MNKILILLLVCCIISAHAFVKRDAPEAPKNDPLDQINKVFEDLKNEATKVINADTFQKGIDDMLAFANNTANAFGDAVKQGLDKVKPKEN